MKMKHGQLMIRTRNIAVIYNRRRSLFRSDPFSALRDINLDLYAGESLGVIGRNGVGKTTLLRILAQIISPDRGTLENFGVSTAMLSLQAGFDNQASGYTNILLSALLLGYSEAEIRDRMQDIVDYSELGDFINQPLWSYSAGMRARLGFSICLYMQPDILLIDEALGVGDIEFRKKSAKAMRDKLKSEQTVVLVSHDVDMIKNLCSRVLWIENGVSRMEGDTTTVIDAYQDFVKNHPRATKSVFQHQ